MNTFFKQEVIDEMACEGFKKKTNGGTIIHATKLPTQLMLQISGYDTIDDAEDRSKSRVNKGKCSVQIDLMLNLMCQGVNMKYILCGVLLYDTLNESTDDLGHYSTMNMDFNTGAWTGMDDDVVRRIYSFTLMNKIPILVDKKQINKIFYCRDNVCTVTYIKNNMYVVN